MSLRGFVTGLALAGAVTVGAAVPASADNTTYNWGGLYLGANAGWSSVDYDQRWVFALGGPPVAPGTTLDRSQDDAIVGGQIGIQHQFGTFVVGAEAAYSSAAAFGDNWTDRRPANGSTFTSELKMDAIFTIGARLGWAPTTRWLLFINGGYATAQVNQRLRNAAGVEQTDLNTSARHDGWYLGGGVEYALTPNWILGLEYQHIDLDTAQHCRGPRVSAGTCLGAGDDTTSRIDADVDIVRARISYKFGRRVEAAPLK
jgi:outer membrane immunogenic protein